MTGAPHILRFAGDSVRLDVWLSQQDATLSRSRWQQLIREEHLQVNGAAAVCHQKLRSGDVITYTLPAPAVTDLIPEDIPLDILFEDRDLLVINKPPGLVVHPAPGHATGTLVNALLFHCRDLQGIGGETRPGIVHRLDRDTSGAMVVAKNESAMEHLAAQFARREVEKEYLAVVWGITKRHDGTVRTLLGRNPHQRKKMSARVKHGREAVSHYETVTRSETMSLLRVRIETGRTHQIRVHMAHLGHPVVGDHEYGRARPTQVPVPVTRQMLHAEKLRFTHPRSGERMEFVAPMREDMQALLEYLHAGDTSARQRTA